MKLKSSHLLLSKEVFTLLILLCIYRTLTVSAAVPPGYYSAATGAGAILKTQLHNIISGHTAKSYDYLWTAFATTDVRNDGTVWDMYSDRPDATPAYLFTLSDNQCGTYDEEGDCYNREHSFPASWFNDAAPMYTDLFHLVPTDGYVNNRRGSFPFGEVGVATWTSTNGSKLGTSVTPGYTGTVFEPIDEYKGDFARAYFYMATRYENLIAGWYANSTEANAILQNNNFPVYETWFLNMLGNWHVQDPVSSKEIARNDAVYAIQGNRNPFIDHPEYVYQIWGIGEMDMQGHVTNFSPRNIHLQWIDATGPVVPDGYLVRVSTTGFDDITAPVDGVNYSSTGADYHVPYGKQQVWIKNLSAGSYYIKIYPYKGSGAAIDYKTDGNIPQISKTLN